MSRGYKQEVSMIGDRHGQITGRHVNRLNRRIQYAQETGQPLEIYIGSCPDYTHNGTTYDFKSVNDGVPLLTVKQISANSALFNRLEHLWRSIPVPYLIG